MLAGKCLPSLPPSLPDPFLAEAAHFRSSLLPSLAPSLPPYLVAVHTILLEHIQAALRNGVRLHLEGGREGGREGGSEGGREGMG